MYLEHPSLPKFLPLAQTYCKTRGRHQNMINVHFFLFRAFFPKSGWSVLQDNRSLKFSKGASRNRSAKRAQISAERAQISANECIVFCLTMPAFLWMEEGDLVELFSGGERFLGGRAESVIRAVYFSYLKAKARWVPQVYIYIYIDMRRLQKP